MIFWPYTFFLWPCQLTCSILVPHPGIKPVPSAVQSWSLSHWMAREVLDHILLKSQQIMCAMADFPLPQKSTVFHEKMLNIIHYYRNSNQNCNEVSPHTFRKAIIKKSTSNKCWRGCEEKGILLHWWWECKLIQPLGEQYGNYFQKLGIKLHYTQQPCYWTYRLRKP